MGGWDIYRPKRLLFSQGLFGLPIITKLPIFLKLGKRLRTDIPDSWPPANRGTVRWGNRPRRVKSHLLSLEKLHLRLASTRTAKLMPQKTGGIREFSSRHPFIDLSSVKWQDIFDANSWSSSPDYTSTSLCSGGPNGGRTAIVGTWPMKATRNWLFVNSSTPKPQFLSPLVAALLSGPTAPETTAAALRGGQLPRTTQSRPRRSLGSPAGRTCLNQVFGRRPSLSAFATAPVIVFTCSLL